MEDTIPLWDTLGLRLSDVAWDGEYLWVGGWAPNGTFWPDWWLCAVDLKTSRAVRRVSLTGTSLGDAVAGLCYGGGALWTMYNGYLSKIDPSSGSLLDTIPLPQPLNSGTYGVTLTFDGRVGAGTNRATVTVFCNEPGKPFVSIPVTFVVRDPFATNHPPVGLNQSVSTEPGVALAVRLTATNADGDALTYGVVAQPAHGSLSGTAPDLNYSGVDSFAYRASDGKTNSNVATATITVANRVPVAQAGNAWTRIGRPVTLTLTGTDPDGDALTYSLANPLAKGTLSGLVSNRVTYTPPRAFVGTDTFGFRACDGQTNSDSAVFTIWVRPNPRIERFGAAGGENLGLWWSEATNGVYVDRSPTLAPTAAWQTVAGPLNSATNWTLTPATNAPQGFYRIRAP